MRQLLIGLVAILGIAGCDSHEHQDDHDHAHPHEQAEPELPGYVYTLYSDHIELFVEFDPLIQGMETRFAAHFTELGSLFTAVDTGTATVTLATATDTVQYKSDAPAVPGIFRLGLIPDFHGQATLTFDIRTPSFTDQIVIDSVMVYPNLEAARAGLPESDAPEGDITYLKEQAWKVDFANAPVQNQPFHQVVRTSGIIIPTPGSESEVVARTSGIVHFSNTSLLPGTSVRSGQRLFTISSAGFTEGNIPVRLTEAQIARQQAEAELARVEKLFADQLATRGELMKAETTVKQAQANYQALSSNYDQDGQAINAGSSGYINSIAVTPGQFIEKGQTLAIITQENRLTVKAELSQTAFGKINQIHSANFKVPGKGIYSMEELNGKILSIGRSLDQSLYIPVWFEVDRQPGFIPGGYIEILIQADEVPDALIIPSSALMEEQGVYYCYVQISGESFEKRELQLGGNDGKHVRVLSGLAEGERVVTKGAYQIKLSTASGALPAHGHEH